MDYTNSRETSPLQNLFVDVKKIIDFMVVKDNEAATEAETDESKWLAYAWMDARMHHDDYTTYQKFWTIDMFKQVAPVTRREFTFYVEHPDRVGLKFRETLRTLGREKFLASYVEKNNYYRMLQGLPDVDDADYVYLPTSLQEKYGLTERTPVHELDEYLQRRYMNTDEYAKVVADNPDKKYLQFMGSNKVDLYTARNAKDFEIIRYPNNRADINPNLLLSFAELYSNYREYVMVVLYNSQFENVYDYYRTFMGTLILEYTLLQIGNSALEAVNNHKYLDDSVLHTILSMYGIPDSLIMNRNSRRDLAINILKLIKEKGTNDVYYDIIQILGYQDVAISKLLLMKGQQFDSEKNPLSTVDPYFLEVDLKDSNPYDTITSGKANRYSYQDIISGDQSWWDTPEVQKILKESDYSMMDTKYITIEATINQMQHMLEMIYFPRMILDNKSVTEDLEIEIPELYGTSTIPVYDIILFIISALCLETGSEAKFVDDDSLQAVAGFNFDIKIDQFKEFLETTSYADKTQIIKFMNAINIGNLDDITRVFSDVIIPMREWLERKVVNASNREEFLEYESIYRALFSYDIAKNSVVNDMNFKTPLQLICEEYDISEAQMQAYQHFYPRQLSGEAIMDSEFENSRYANSNEFRSKIAWKFNITVEVGSKIDERGFIYLHDILNYHDCRDIPHYVMGNDGTYHAEGRMFMDYVSEEEGWVVNQDVVKKVIEKINYLDDNQLNGAYFVADTPIINSGGLWYNSGTKLSKIAPVFKNILIEKIEMDMDGRADPADNYYELLRRRNVALYNTLFGTTGDRYTREPESWLNDVMSVFSSLETELSIHLKYYEHSVLGKDMFFKPLITLINHFKSMMVHIAKTGVRYIFDSKMDITGTSNMFQLFDDTNMTIHFTTIANSGFSSEFALYDTIPSTKRNVVIKDQTRLIKETIGSGFATEVRTRYDGSIHMVDEAKFYLNGKAVDPNDHASVWFNGEPGTGRWSEEDDILVRTRMGQEHIKDYKVDYDGWKDFIISQSPV